MPPPQTFNHYRCRITKKLGTTKGCHCIACDHIRSYYRVWNQDQRRLNTPYATRQRSLDSHRHHSTARRMYDHLRYLAIRDNLWSHTPDDQQ